MDRFQLARLVEWAGTLQTRKRLQKVVYLLKRSGCPLDAEFTLHHYGPYSFDVARLTDEMVRTGLLEEQEDSNAAGRQFSYTLSDRARELLDCAAAGGANATQHAAFDQFRATAETLLGEQDLKKLEYAATIAFFHERLGDWKQALEQAAKFKGQQQNGPAMQNALALARKVTG